MIVTEKDQQRSLQQLNHGELCILLRSRDERQVQLTADEIVGELRGGAAVKRDLESRV